MDKLMVAMRTTLRGGLVAFFFVGLFAFQAHAETTVVDAIDHGSYGIDDFTPFDGTHNAGNTNYIAQVSSVTDQVRNFFVFDLSGVTEEIGSAKLRIESVSTNPSGNTYTVYDVDTDITVLRTSHFETGPGEGNAEGRDIFADLGTGVEFGSTTVTFVNGLCNPNVFPGTDPACPSVFEEIEFNAAGLAALNSATGDFAVGGRINAGHVFGSSGGAFGGFSVTLVLQTGVEANAPPTAVAGADQSIRAGDMVDLDGSASFDDNTASAALDYFWSFFSQPVGSTAVLSDANTATPSFDVDVAGTYVVELVVTDGSGLDSEPVQVEVSSDNLAPTAVVGDDVLVIIPTGEVVLDGTGSTDPEDDPLSFQWTLTSGPAGSTATISDPDMDLAGLTPDVEGVYEATLTVSDFLGPGTPKTVVITATTAQDFAEDQIVSTDQTVADLLPGQMTTGGNQNAFQNFMTQAIVALQAGDVAEAINKLEKAIARTDGCELRDAPDGNGMGRDWITDCAVQIEVYGLLNAALNELLVL